MNAKLCKKLRKLARIATDKGQVVARDQYKPDKTPVKVFDKKTGKVLFVKCTWVLHGCEKAFYRKLKKSMGSKVWV